MFDVRMRAHTYSSVVGGLLRGAVWRALGGVGVFVEAVSAVDAVAREGRVGLEFAFDDRRCRRAPFRLFVGGGGVQGSGRLCQCLWTENLSSQTGSQASLEHIAWGLSSPCCPTLGRADASAPTCLSGPCRPARRPRKRGARVSGLHLHAKPQNRFFWLVTLIPARSQRVCQPAFVVSMQVATAEPARPLVCATQQSLSLWSKSLRHEQTRRIGSRQRSSSKSTEFSVGV
eukprot:scaffold6061_cov94-Isochrysis_galbana.AAC.1